MVEQGSTLVKAMLGFSRADDVKLRVEDVGALVEDTARLLSDRIPPEVEVVLDVTPGLPPVHGTRDWHGKRHAYQCGEARLQQGQRQEQRRRSSDP